LYVGVVFLDVTPILELFYVDDIPCVVVVFSRCYTLYWSRLA